MSRRGFCSPFAEDLDNMIDLMVVSGGAESSYLPRARSFDTFCAHEHPECSELTEWLILEWLRPVMKKEPAVIHQRICFMNGFARYLNNVGKPAFMMHNRFACGRTLFVPYIFSDDDLTRLFHVIDTNGKHGNLFQRIQFSVYYRLIYTCGLRPNEGRTLRKKHVDLHAGEIVIECSKERRSRIVVMSDDMRALAARYSSLLNACFPDTEFFFPSKHGREYPAAFFQTNLVRFFAEANPAIPADFLPRVRVYDLRHRFATAAVHRWLEQGKPVDAMLPYLQMYMGHARLSSTAYYIHLLPEHLVKASGMNWEEIGDILPGVELWQD